MPRFMIKIEDTYFMWSTVINAPITTGMTRSRALDYLETEYPNVDKLSCEEHMTHTDMFGTGNNDWTLDKILALNCAGDNETALTLEEILERYKNG